MFLFFFLILFPLSLSSEKLNFDISKTAIVLDRENKQPSFTIYGFNQTKNLLVIKIKGPRQKVILQKKVKFLNMWTWEKSGEFSFPSIFHYYTNTKTDDIDFRLKKNLHDNIKLLGKDNDNLKKDLIKNKMQSGLFLIKNKSFDFIDKKDPIFFKIPIKIPYSAPSGKYQVILETYEKEKIVNNKTKSFYVKKLGFNSFIYYFAHNFSFLYGIVSVIVAVSLGVGAGFIFRK